MATITDQDCKDIITVMRDLRGYAESVALEDSISGTVETHDEWVQALAHNIGAETVIEYAQSIHSELAARVRGVLGIA